MTLGAKAFILYTILNNTLNQSQNDNILYVNLAILSLSTLALLGFNKERKYGR